MRTFFLLILFIVAVTGFSQVDSPATRQSDTTTVRQQLDTTNEYLNEIRSKEWEDRNLAGLQQLMAEQEARRAKEKRRAVFRIVLGAFFLVILIVGLRRKRKKTAN